MAADETPSAITLATHGVEEMSKNEAIKAQSQGLVVVTDKDGSHSFRDELDQMERGEAVTIGNVAKELSKFHGIYKQQGRGERGKKTQDFFFMLRIKNPGGGRLSTSQYLALDDAADQFADGTLRITSRQAIQYHHVYGDKLAALVRHLNRSYMDHGTLSACGDVNRNVMASPIDDLDPEFEVGGLTIAQDIAELLAPKTSGYFEIFMSDGGDMKKRITDEPIYGPQYLPRKFKIGIAHPTDNSADIRTNDVGLVPVDGAGEIWDFYTGGGMGLSHNKPETAAHLAIYLGRVRREQIPQAVRGVVELQRDHGERKNRKQARWKYTIRRLGVDAVKKQLREEHGVDLQDAEPIRIPDMNLHLGWHEQRGGGSYYGLSVESGRLKGAARKAVRQAVETLGLSVVLTGQQDLVLCDIQDRAALEAIFDEHGVTRSEQVGRARANAMACPAKPTCGLAMTDAENILPDYFDALEAEGLGDVDVVIRMTGCPNNCARPPSAEIGIYGYGKNDHVVLVGGSRNGDRLAHTLYERLSGEKMIPALKGLFRAIQDRAGGTPAGDFLHDTDPATLRSWVGIEEGA